MLIVHGPARSRSRMLRKLRFSAGSLAVTEPDDELQAAVMADVAGLAHDVDVKRCFALGTDGIVFDPPIVPNMSWALLQANGDEAEQLLGLDRRGRAAWAQDPRAHTIVFVGKPCLRTEHLLYGS